MPCCGGNESDGETTDGVVGKKSKDQQLDNEHSSFIWHPTIKNTKKIAYVRQLERRYECLQSAYFNLSAELARLQVCLRQIVRADSCERAKLIDEIKSKGFKNADCNILPTLEQHNAEMGSLHRKQHLLMATLRQRIGSFQQASDELNNNYRLADGKESQISISTAASLKTNQSKTSKTKETSSIKIIKYADKPQDEANTNANTKRKRITKLCNLRNKLKSNPKSSTKDDKSTKKEDAEKLVDETARKTKVSSSENLNSKAASPVLDKKSNQAITPVLPPKKAALSAETLSSGQSIVSTRSASFKELRAKYQQNQGPGK